MTTMYEIYDKFADKYDELINKEDYQKNLNEYLLNSFDWNNKTVIEFGVGTGRVTDIYIDKVDKVLAFDRALHMMDKAKVNLKSYLRKIKFEECDNKLINSVNKKADIFIEGWSFFHTLSDDYENYLTVFDKMMHGMRENTIKGGDIILIETMGTMTDNPIDSGFMTEYHKMLEEEYLFKRKIIRTDYKFNNCEEAARIMGFFFGNEMYEKILASGLLIIPEFTGVWNLKNN